MNRTVVRITLGIALVVGSLACGGMPTEDDQACWFDDDACVAHVKRRLQDPTADAASMLARLGDLCRSKDHAEACHVHGMRAFEPGDISRLEGAESLRRACAADRTGSCFQQARLWGWPGEGQDYVRARALYDTLCDAGNGAACNNLGVFYGLGHGVVADPAQATALYGKACDADDPMGCVNFGRRLVAGSGIARDPARARAVWATACDAGESEGCLELALALRKPEGGPVDLGRSIRLIKTACDGGLLKSCGQQADDVLEGVGQPADPASAVVMLDEICTRGHSRSCNTLGVAFDNGRTGVPVDKARAKALFDKACGMDNARACLNMVFHTEEALHAGFKKKACDLGSSDGCNDFAYVVENDGDQARARTLYAKACDMGNALACENAGILYSRKPAETETAAVFFTKACQRGRKSACNRTP